MANDDHHQDSDSLGGDDTRRQMASLRMRKYRSLKKEEFRRIEDECRSLQQTLHHLLRQRAHSGGDPPPATSRMIQREVHHSIAEQVARHTRHLRHEVEANYKLAFCLRDWVASQHPAPSLTPQMPWIYATLSANPDVRWAGLQWLSERLLHTANSVVPQHPMDVRGGDAIHVSVHSPDHTDDPIASGAMEFHFQFYIVFVPFSDVVSALVLLNSQRAFVVPDVVACQMVEEANSLRYTYAANPHNGVTLRQVTALFHTPDSTRAVLTSAKVTDDEMYPLQDGEVRSHGFGWCGRQLGNHCSHSVRRTVAESVGPNITTIRGSTLYYAPISTTGPISFEEVGDLFGVDHRQYRCRSDLIAQVQSQAEATVTACFRRHVHALRHHLDGKVTSPGDAIHARALADHAKTGATISTATLRPAMSSTWE
ncbi:hypothetical protein H310_08735 [Aphanomyces invadans]|uniref:START domain-containing protein n=1 Tax=Aphanomyces invadans TaxID=157072 RepID=A0A024TZ31_9STRA|nr:hypothetical protein H310_08735 [Aphanomyces invadans]ETV98617.1 hypothetical protein H310_08735 [Aphanomyces invadans]|eukprot:XP_008872814.1 hypothetical protein H310_08735 [Aphanomyces invadans]